MCAQCIGAGTYDPSWCGRTTESCHIPSNVPVSAVDRGICGSRRQEGAFGLRMRPLRRCAQAAQADRCSTASRRCYGLPTRIELTDGGFSHEAHEAHRHLQGSRSARLLRADDGRGGLRRRRAARGILRSRSWPLLSRACVGRVRSRRSSLPLINSRLPALATLVFTALSAHGGRYRCRRELPWRSGLRLKNPNVAAWAGQNGALRISGVSVQRQRKSLVISKIYADSVGRIDRCTRDHPSDQRA